MSNIKRIVQIVLLVVVVGSVGYLIAKEFSSPRSAPPTADTSVPANTNIKPDHLIAYYFHGDFRCANCRKIEAYSKESIEKNFGNQLKNGTLTFNIINVDKPENRHYIQDYGLFTKSLVVVSYSGDKQLKYKNLKDVWNYLNSKDEFENYVKTEVLGLINEVGK